MLLELFFNKELNFSLIKKAISNVLGIKEIEIDICRYDDILKLSDNKERLLLGIVDSQEGTFHFSFQINSRQIELPKDQHLEIIGNLTELLQSQCIVSNDYFDIYSEGMILVSGKNRYTGVIIDENEEYGPPFCIIKKWTANNLTLEQFKIECARLYMEYYQ
jgi:hypothetical protein